MRRKGKEAFVPSAIGKNTYYATRGKVHLIHEQRFEGQKTYCGLGLEHTNHHTVDEKETTCQRCLAYKHHPGRRRS